MARHVLLVTKEIGMRKPPGRATRGREPEIVTTNQIVAWLDTRLRQDRDLRRAVARVLAALRKEQAASVRRARRAR
jgi:hypothetical protein